MKAEIETYITDWDYDGPEALEPRTNIKISVTTREITITLPDDSEKLGALFNRTVTLEMHPDDGLRVLVYPFDGEEPKVLLVDVQGEIGEREA